MDWPESISCANRTKEGNGKVHEPLGSQWHRKRRRGEAAKNERKAIISRSCCEFALNVRKASRTPSRPMYATVSYGRSLPPESMTYMHRACSRFRAHCQWWICEQLLQIKRHRDSNRKLSRLTLNWFNESSPKMIMSCCFCLTVVVDKLLCRS